MTGKFIVLYGINNLGKSTQAKMLVERLTREGYKAEYLKYALYNLSPSGPLLNAYLREGNPHSLSPREFQILQVMNRTQYEPILREKLASGIHVIAEDYVGTGIAWGIGAGVDEGFLKTLNTHLLKEDLGLLFQGKRFLNGLEHGHAHEENTNLTERVRLAHEKLGTEYGWKNVNANDTIENIHEHLWTLLKNYL